MRRLFESIAMLASDEQFFAFQNSLVQSLYDCLGQGYGRGENEVALVTRLVDVANGKNYGPLRLSAKMLHGSRSYVEFNYLDKPVTKELGDMAVISVVTSGKSRLLQKTCIVQNKKANGNSWHIDLEQLFLLKNFPPFSGNKGIFRGCREVAFRNGSGCLGAFGLLSDPGEMRLVSAPHLGACMVGKQSISISDLAGLGRNGHGASEGGSFAGAPWPLLFSHFHPKEWFMFEEVLHRFGPTPLAWSGSGALPFLGNMTINHDLYDFVRAWSQLSIGEMSCVAGQITNRPVDAFSNFLLRSAGLTDGIALPGDNFFADHEFDGQMAVLLLHLNLDQEG